ncbi:MAG: hypothetical protein ACLPTZ_03325 [Beijerinckiaceae bacterium]
MSLGLATGPSKSFALRILILERSINVVMMDVKYALACVTSC